MSSSRPSEPAEGIAPVVLVVGSEATLRRAALAELRARVLGDAMPEFNEDRFDLAEPGLQLVRIPAAARMRPVGAARRLVVVRGLSDRRAERFLTQELPRYLEDPVPTTCLVLVADKVDRRLAWVKRIKEHGEVIDCSGPSRPAELRSWIRSQVKARGKQMAGGSAETLLELVGREIDALTAEIDKVCLYALDRAEITPDDVAEVAGHLRPLAVYELTEAIGQRQSARSLQMLARLLDQGESPLAMLGALANHFRRLIRACECRPLDAREVQRQLGVHPYAAQKLAEQVRRFDPARLRGCLSAMRRTDEAIKGGVPLEPRLAIERLVLAVCA